MQPSNHPVTKAFIPAVVYPYDQISISSYSLSYNVLDKLHLAMEPSDSEYNNCVFGRYFGIHITHSSSIGNRRATNQELLRCYSVPSLVIPTSIDMHDFALNLDNNLQYCVPFSLHSCVTNSLLSHVNVSTDIPFNVSEVSDNQQCYQMSRTPTTLDWVSAYNLDSSICAMKLCFDKRSQHGQKNYWLGLSRNIIHLLFSTVSNTFISSLLFTNLSSNTSSMLD